VRNKIQTIISDWFEEAETASKATYMKDDRHSVTLCTVAVALMRTYCEATANLLENGFLLPAAALLRITSEFFIKILWCIKCETEDETKDRIDRWERSSGEEKLKLWSNLLEQSHLLQGIDVSKLEQLSRETEDALTKNVQQKGMPHITGTGGLFDQCSEVFGTNVSALLYGQLCPAVHIDTSVLRGLVQNQDDLLVIERDRGNEVDLKRRCLNIAYMFLLVIGKKMGSNVSTLTDQYEKSVADLDESQ
jgi:hypothetical protein